MLLRYLKKVVLKKATKVKQANGNIINTYDKIATYNVQTQDLTDDVVSATIYGASISKILRLSSPLNKLEKYLLPKVENTQDNISFYYIEIDNKLYKIKSVAIDKIDVELVTSITQDVSN